MASTGNPYNLTDLRWAFVQQYLVDLNGTEAYLRAGYKATRDAARRAAARLLTNGDILAAIQGEKDKRARRVQLTQDAVLEELHLLSHSTVEHYQVDNQGNLTLAPGAPPWAMRAVSSLKKKVIYRDNGIIYEVEFRLWNKPASLRMAGEHLGTFERGAVQSTDIQAAQAARAAALQEARAQLARIKARHVAAAEVVP